MHHHAVISFWLQRIKWSSSDWWHSGVSAPPWARMKLSNTQSFQEDGGQKDPEAFQCHVFTALVMCLSLERVVEVSGEGVQSGAAISHLEHILPGGIRHDIIMTSPYNPTDGPLLFQHADKHTHSTHCKNQSFPPPQQSTCTLTRQKIHTSQASLRRVHSEPCESFVWPQLNAGRERGVFLWKQ